MNVSFKPLQRLFLSFERIIRQICFVLILFVSSNDLNQSNPAVDKCQYLNYVKL